MLLHFCCKQEQAPVISGDLFPSAGKAEDGLLPTLTKEQILERMQTAADAAYITASINARPVFENGKAKGNLNIENPNTNVFPMVVEIYRNDTGEIIYSSGGILPEQYIQSDKLGVVLKKGEYEATAHMIAFDPKTGERLGHYQVALVITIAN